jgi:hypothetical protein
MSPKRSPVRRRREHECDRASGKNAALQWPLGRPSAPPRRTAPLAAMRSRKVVYARGPVTPIPVTTATWPLRQRAAAPGRTSLPLLPRGGSGLAPRSLTVALPDRSPRGGACAFAADVAVEFEQAHGCLGGGRCSPDGAALWLYAGRARLGCPVSTTSESPGGSSGVTLATRPMLLARSGSEAAIGPAPGLGASRLSGVRLQNRMPSA